MSDNSEKPTAAPENAHLRAPLARQVDQRIDERPEPVRSEPKTERAEEVRAA